MFRPKVDRGESVGITHEGTVRYMLIVKYEGRDGDRYKDMGGGGERVESGGWIEGETNSRSMEGELKVCLRPVEGKEERLLGFLWRR